MVDFFNYSQEVKNEIALGNPQLRKAIQKHIIDKGMGHLDRIYPLPSAYENKGWALFQLGQYTKPERAKDGTIIPFDDHMMYAGHDTFEHGGKQYDFMMLHPFEVFRHDMTSDLEYFNILQMLDNKAKFFEDEAISGRPISEFCIGVMSGYFAALLVGGEHPAHKMTQDENFKYLRLNPKKSSYAQTLKKNGSYDFRYMNLERMVSWDVPKHLQHQLSKLSIKK